MLKVSIAVISIAATVLLVSIFWQAQEGIRPLPFSRDDQSPKQLVQSLLPSSWTVQSQKNTVPALWQGAPVCEEISAVNSSEQYHDPHGFDYAARHTFWFCPKQWLGQPPKIRMEEQVYPAATLGDSELYQIFYFSLGENSQPNLPEQLKKMLNIKKMRNL